MSSTYTPLDGLNFTVPAAAQSVVSVGTCGLVISNNLDPIVPVPPQFNVCSSSLVCTYASYCKISTYLTVVFTGNLGSKCC